MSEKAEPAVLTYFDEQVAALRTHLPAAFTAFDETAVHQARVATRRLKAAFDVLAPATDDLNTRKLADAGRTIRRRLGPLRDLDVMAGHLAEGNLPAKSADAADWVRRHLETRRTDARDGVSMGPKRLAKLAGRLDDWLSIRAALADRGDAVGPLLTTALHERFDAFAALADRVTGLVASPDDAPPVDVHALRIDGKAVRYAFELAAAHGLDVPKRVAKTFKAMQDALGAWHDEVVLTETVLRAVVDADLPLHRPTLSVAVLDVAQTFLRRSVKSLDAFKSQWKRAGRSLRTTLAECVPLTTAVAAEAPETTPMDGGAIGDAASEVMDNDAPVPSPGTAGRGLG